MPDHLTIIELPPFSKNIAKILDKDAWETLHDYLASNPEKGVVIPGTGGMRKLRWAGSGRGKRGGARVIYYYHVVGSTIYLLACYTKNTQTDIRPEVKRQLKAMIDQIKSGK